MREMKDSGVQWIGSVPISWQLLTIGSLFKVRNGKVNDSDYPPLSVSKGGIVPQMENVAKSDANDNRKMVLTDDFVINSRSDRKQSCGVSPCDGSVSLINTVLYSAKGAPIVSAYLNYLLKNYGFAEEFYRWGHGIVADLWTTRWQEMKSILLPIPSEEEQESILDFISVESQKVDALIANVQAQIEKLKQYKQSLITEVVTRGLDPSVPMKDSGVESIERIPLGWTVSRIKYICHFNPSKKRVIGDDEVVSYAPMECVKNGFLVPKEIATGNVNSGLTYFENGDIIMAKVTPCFENGNIAIAEDLKNGVGYGSSELFVFRSTKVNRRWLMYFLRNEKFLDSAKATMTGTGGLKRVSPIFVQSLHLAIPGETVQEEIVSYLDTQCEKVDQLISLKQTKIDKLNEYKKSLIYEYVTGKREA